MQRLYKATVESEFFVLADSVVDACSKARAYVHQAMRDQEPELGFVDEVTDIQDVPKEWRDSYPYGQGRDEKTCVEILGVKP